jgi:F-type H+-transporting ATPase subunit c
MKKLAPFAVLAIALVALLVPAVALAAPEAAPAAATAGGFATSATPSGDVYALAVVLGIGLAAFGCGQGQGRAASAALEGICRNPGAADRVFTPMLLGLAFIESLVIFTFVSAFIVK